MRQSGRVSNMEHLLSLGSFRSWLRLLFSGRDVDRQFLYRTLFVSLSTLATSPLRLYERLRYRRILEATQIVPSPVFIIGHWRTGTTHLHNLLCQDTSLGYVTMFQAFAPGICLTGEKTFKGALDRLAQRRHPTREIDNMPLSVDNPEEEELALANLSPHSVLHWYTFPRQAGYFFDRYALFEELPEPSRTEWSRVYMAILRKATLKGGRKRLVLKNCANTGRIRVLLDLFPNAKFVHICRNPYDVFCSTLHLYKTVLRRSQLQEVGAEEIEALVLRFYRQLMQNYLRDKALIPAGNLVEIKFEDLEAAPLDQVRRIYDELGLPGFAQAEPGLRGYLASVADYQKNHYELDDRATTEVNRNWGFAFDEWGYERRRPEGS